MKNLISSVRSSAENISRVSVIAVCGMLLAMHVVLSSFTIMLTPQLKIGFASLPIAAAGFLFGPVVGGVMGAAGDIISYLIRPVGPYFPGLTLSGFIGGFIYGILLYKKHVTLLRTSLTKVAVFICISLLLDPLWLCIMYGKSFIAVFIGRFVTKTVMLPVDIFFLYILLRIIEKGSGSFIKDLHFKHKG